MSNSKVPVSVIVVGAGFAGLTAAIECARKGHSVVLLDKMPKLEAMGDIIGFQSNAARIFEQWPGVRERLEPIRHHPSDMCFHDWHGRFVTSQSWDDLQCGGRRLLNGNRGEIHAIVYEHATKQPNIDIRLGYRVRDYFETDDHAGVVVTHVDSGASEVEERLTADVVLAAEGVRSRGRKIVLGFEDTPKASVVSSGRDGP